MFGSGVSLSSTLKKVSCDQLCYGPLFTGALLSIIGLTQGHDIKMIKEKLNNELVDVVLTGWKVRNPLHLINNIMTEMYNFLFQIWPACQLINFYFVPFLIRPLFVNIVAFFWNSYLAWKSNR